MKTALEADATGRKDTNPKDALGSDKIPLHLWPISATALGALALLDGALKYGRSNYRAVGVRATIYTDAAGRHLGAWLEGEDLDPVSGLPHLGHVLACVAILIEADEAGVLTDDRMYPTRHRSWWDRMTKHVPRLKALHAKAGHVAKDYDIRDRKEPVFSPGLTAEEIRKDWEARREAALQRSYEPNPGWIQGMKDYDAGLAALNIPKPPETLNQLVEKLSQAPSWWDDYKRGVELRKAEPTAKDACRSFCDDCSNTDLCRFRGVCRMNRPVKFV